MAKTARDYKELLRSGRWFQALPDAFADALLDAATVREVTDGTRLFARGDAPDGLYAIVDGAIRVSSVGESGKEAVLALVEPPQWFGEIAVFDRLPRTHDTFAAADSVLLHVASAPLDALLAKHPAWWRDLALLVTTKLRLSFGVMEDMALMPLSARVVRRLVAMADGYGEFHDRSRRVLQVSQELLAAMVGSSRQSANQVLKELEGRGLIKVAYGEIEVLDLPALKGLAQS